MADDSPSLIEEQPISQVEEPLGVDPEAVKDVSTEADSGAPIPGLSFSAALSGSGSIHSSNEFKMVDVKEEEEVSFETPQSAPSSWKSGLTPRKPSSSEHSESTLGTRYRGSFTADWRG